MGGRLDPGGAIGGAVGTQAGNLDPPSSSRKRTRLPVWGKVLLGCAIGCALVGFVAFGALLYGLWWVASPGAQVGTDVAIAPESVAVVRFSGNEQSGALAELIGIFMTESGERARRAQAPRLPGWLRTLEEVARVRNPQNAAGVAMLVPREATVAIAPSGDGRWQTTAAVNFQGFLRPVRALVLASARNASARNTIIPHGGDEIVRLSSGSALGFAGGTLLLADHEALVAAALARARENAAPPAPSIDLTALHELERRFLLACVVDNRTGVLSYLIGRWVVVRGRDDAAGRQAGPAGPGLEALARMVERLTLGIALPSADRAEVDVAVALPNAAAVHAWRDGLQAELTAQQAAAMRKGLSLDWTITSADRRLNAKLALTGLVDFVRRMADDTARRLEPAPSSDGAMATPGPSSDP